MRQRAVRRRAARALLLGVIPAAVIAGCGIRATEVPVDSGPAPSRKPCPVADPSPVPSNDARVPVRVYLLCAGELTLVERTVGLPRNTEGRSRRTLVAQGLLGELARPPLTGEAADGYRTLVPFGTRVEGHRRGDPAEAFRLNVRPDRLRAGALAQIVCTFAESAATQGAGSVILGGPKGDLTRYECPPDVRDRPTAAPVPSATAAPAE